MLSTRKDKHFRIQASLEADFVRTAKILGLKQEEAAEIALKEWIQGNREEAQKRLDLYAEKGIVIHQPQAVQINVAVFQKAEVLCAKHELERLLGVLDAVTTEKDRSDTQLELAKALKIIQPAFVKSRDPKLAELLQQADEALQQ
jgi:hypothetical protein